MPEFIPQPLLNDVARDVMVRDCPDGSLVPNPSFRVDFIEAGYCLLPESDRDLLRRVVAATGFDTRELKIMFLSSSEKQRIKIRGGLEKTIQEVLK